jgi:intein/homing endonuclease
LIRTTPEHPFYVDGKGWTAAGALKAGDRIATLSGEWVPIGEVFDTEEWELVYNLRVADFHTYFVGEDGWGFSAWAHNAYDFLSGLKVAELVANNLATTSHPLSAADRDTIIHQIEDEGKYGARGDQSVLVGLLTSAANGGQSIGDTLKGYLGRSGVRRSLFAGERKIDALDFKSATMLGERKQGVMAYIYTDLGDLDARGKSYQQYIDDFDGRTPRAPVHGHHIVYKIGKGTANAPAKDAKDILLYYGINPYFDRENLCYAPNPGAHGAADIISIDNQLRTAFQNHAERSVIVQILKDAADRWVQTYG